MIVRAQLWFPFHRLVAVAGLGVAFLCGALIGRSPALGVAFLLMLAYLPLVIYNLPAALAVWIMIMFIRLLPGLSIGPNAASLLVAAGYFGHVLGRRSSGALGAHRALPAAVGLLLGWMSTSALWAQDAGAMGSKIWQWYVGALVLVVVAGTVRSRRHAEIVMAGFVGGAVLSVSLGLVVNGLAGTSSAYETATQTEGRLQGGSGDPNFLAAGVVPALALTYGLFQTIREPVARMGLYLAVLLLTVGLVATQSRGGLIAAAVGIVATIVLARGRRLVLVGALAGLMTVAGGWLVVNPEAVARVTSTDQGGNGRSELWEIARRMGSEHPITGVGLNNFRTRSPEFVLDAGSLRFVELIVERPHVVHNAYLQVFAETGLVGLALLLAVLVLSMASARTAARRFEARGDPEGAALARGLFVALLCMAVAATFLSNGEDPRLWLLIGLGPALLAMASAPAAAPGVGHAKTA